MATVADRRYTPLRITNVRLVRLAALLLALLLCACGGRKGQIVGKWQTADEASPVTWEFQRNGGVISGETRGRYSFGDQERIKIEMPTATFVYQIEFDGDRMIWTERNGTRREFRKLP